MFNILYIYITYMASIIGNIYKSKLNLKKNSMKPTYLMSF